MASTFNLEKKSIVAIVTIVTIKKENKNKLNQNQQ